MIDPRLHVVFVQMKALHEYTDHEWAHGRADQYLEEVIEILGRDDETVRSILDSYRRLTKWYG